MQKIKNKIRKDKSLLYEFHNVGFYLFMNKVIELFALTLYRGIA